MSGICFILYGSLHKRDVWEANKLNLVFYMVVCYVTGPSNKPASFLCFP